MKEQYTVIPIPKKEAIPWIMIKHYAKRKPSITNAFGLYRKDTLIGICTFGMPPVQMNDGKFINKNLLIRELTRLVINDSHQKNAGSFFIGKCFKSFHDPILLVSFADPNQGHCGFIYQATNWIYTGLTDKGGKDKIWKMGYKTYHGKTITAKYLESFLCSYNPSLNLYENWKNNGGIVKDQIQKHRYFYILGPKKFKKETYSALQKKYSILPYPKGESKRYDSGGKVQTQGQLFL